MGKTMRTLVALLTLTACASAQTYKTVTADTNNVIRTNFSLVRSQVSDLSGATFAISNVTGLQAAIDGKLSASGDAASLTNFPASLLRTNGSASALTNFPVSILPTNSSASVFPLALLRTNGDGSGLTNLPNANLTNATGVLPISNGGTGQTNAAAAISALLPSYTGNSNRVLALNSNGTSLVWTTNSGGGGGGTNYTNAQDAMLGLFFASTNDDRISLFANGGTNANNQHTVIGSGAKATGTNAADNSVSIGALAETSRDGIAIGYSAFVSRGLAVGYQSDSTGQGVALGWNAVAAGGNATNGSVAVGRFATAQTNSAIAIGDGADADGVGAISIGRSSLALEDTNGLPATAIGFDSQASGRSVALGANAVASGDAGITIGPNASGTDSSIVIGDGAQINSGTAIQLGNGTNATADSIQIWNAGSVGTNAWGALANSTTVGREIMQAATNGGNGQVLAWTNGDVFWTGVSNTVTDASTLTNFPSSILQTNSAANLFPESLLRTNGNGAALTNVSAANVTGIVALASNVTATVAITNGGSGATTASNARINFLPSYTGNSNRVLALNSNATDVVWAIDGGGTIDLSTANATGVLPITKGGTGGSSTNDALHQLGIVATNTSSIALKGAWATRTVNIGGGISASTDLVIVGLDSSVTSHTGSVLVGYNSDAAAGSFGVAVGYGSKTRSNNAVAVGYNADVRANNAVQLAQGQNTSSNTIQFLSAGTVNTNEWNALANISTNGFYAMTNTAGISGSKTFVAYDGTNYTTNTVTFSNGIITGWTP